MHNYDSPVDAVLLRILAWEIYEAGRDLRVVDAKSYVQTARKELGLRELSGGAPDDVLQRLRKKKLLSEKRNPPKPLEKDWPKAWRWLYLPSHLQVRRLSEAPISLLHPLDFSIQPYRKFAISLRNPAMPKLELYVGAGSSLKDAAANRRGIYFLRHVNNLYIGQTGESQVRLGQHASQEEPAWSVFLLPSYEGHFKSRDVLDATEAMLLAFWGEICVLQNAQRGQDRRPDPDHLQQAILLTEAISAVMVWLFRGEHTDGEGNSINILKDLKLKQQSLPFKPWSGPGWLSGKAYMRKP